SAVLSRLSRATRPRLACEFADRAVVRHEHGIPRTQECGVQVDASAIHHSDHSAVTSARLAVVLVHECLRADRTGLSSELLRFRVPLFANLWRIYECQPNSCGANIERVPVHDVRHSVGEAGSGAFALRGAARWWSRIRVAGR